MGEVISFNSYNGARSCATVQDNKLQRRAYKDDPCGFNRKSLIVQFVKGKGIRAVGRVHPEGEAGAENDIRAALRNILPGSALRRAA